QHGAGPALAVVAALLRGRVPQVITQCVEQGGARVEGQSVLLTVDDKVHWMTHRAPPSARSREVESTADERGWQPSQAASCDGATLRRASDHRIAHRQPRPRAPPRPRASRTV